MEQKCQIVRETSTSGVIRSGLIRSGLIRSGAIRSAAVEGRESVPAASVPSMSVPAVSLPSQSVPAESLPYERLSEGVDAARGSETVSYQASESVLFAYNESVLLPAAGETLDAILADARAKGFNGPVKVEGHTDDTGPDAGNQALSEARARAVADHLTRHGVPADRITVVGHGEAIPAHPNDSEENRARNRRVVIDFTQD
ncbi:OmpA family protein [Propioniciclava sp. MC1595]|nr:OmpA family protein [Propioniciclava sp. MC1595]